MVCEIQKFCSKVARLKTPSFLRAKNQEQNGRQRVRLQMEILAQSYASVCVAKKYYILIL